MLASLLRKWGYECITASDGDEAWNILSLPDAPRLAILDWKMPGMAGVDIIRKIREIGGEEYVYTILLTGKDTRDDLIEGMKAGADDYIVKPFDPQELKVRLRAATRIIEQQKELIEVRKQEVRIAARIQKTLLFGQVVHDLDWVDNAVVAQPALEVGGDFYDFFKHGSSCFDVVLGDVMGKGIPAALLGAGVKSRILHVINDLLAGHSEEEPPGVGEIVNSVNKQITHELIELESFITCCYARFDREAKVFTLVDCGHMPVVHVRAATGEMEMLKSFNLPFGVLIDEEYAVIRRPFDHGDVFCFYSDGLTDMRGRGNKMFADKQLADEVHARLHQEPRRIVGALVEKIVEFTHGEMSDDDVTCIVIKIK